MEIDLKKTYPGEGGPVGWKRVSNPPNPENEGNVNLNAIYKPDDYVAAYALTYLYSPVDQKVRFLLGVDDSVRVWLNDELILSDKSGCHEAWPPHTATELTFVRKGWNKILLRVSDECGGKWGFYFRTGDKQGRPLPGLKFDPNAMNNDQ